MRQFKATQNTAEGPKSLVLRLIGKLIFMKGEKMSDDYVDKLTKDFKKMGASIIKGNGGWIRVDIVKDNEFVKLGDVEFKQSETSQEEIETILYNFFHKKYKEAKFLVQEIEVDE